MSTLATFRPSDVVLAVPPLVGTMGHAEAEFAAAVIVRTLAANGDTWRPVESIEISAVMRSDADAQIEPFASLVRNPFFRPDIHDTVKRGFARWVNAPGGAVELTAAGIEALRRWVQAGPPGEARRKPSAEE